MKKQMLLTAAMGLSGASALLACAPAQPQALEPAPANQAVPAGQETESPFRVEQTDPVVYDKVSHVRGEFRFDQNVVTPSDKVFSLFGTAATALCAAPGFTFGDADGEDYYVSVNGGMEKGVALSLNQIRQSSQTNVMKCSCSTSGSLANAQVTGMPLRDVVEMAGLTGDVNTVTVRGSDGYGKALPLKLALDSGAMLVYAVGGQGLTPENGGPVQLWMPGVVASYFTRQVTEIELTAQAEEPAVELPGPAQRAKVSIVNTVDGDAFAAGDQLTFEGYADDCGATITAVEFSLDGGETWTACSTEGATADRWVYWYFSYVPEAAGTYKLDVRARTSEGSVSPLAASVVFTVA